MRITKAKKPVQRAFTRHKRVFGQNTDKDLETYNKLDLPQMVNIVERYGVKEAARYIRRMEAKRMGIKK